METLKGRGPGYDGGIIQGGAVRSRMLAVCVGWVACVSTPVALGQAAGGGATTRPATGPSTAPVMRVWECEEREYAVFTAVVKFEFGDGRSKVPGGSPAAGQRVRQFVVAVQT